MGNNNSFIIVLQAILDKVKSVVNIKSDIKRIESKLPKIKTDIQTASGVEDSKVNSMMQSYNRMAKDLSSTIREYKRCFLTPKYRQSIL